MKKLFNHTKRPVEDWNSYDENDYDWDNPDYDGAEEYDEEEGYYEEGSYYIEEQPEETELYEEAEYYGEAEEAGEPPVYEEAEYYEAEGSDEPPVYEKAYREPEALGGVEAYEEAEYYEEPEEAGEMALYEEAEYYGEPEEVGELPAYGEAEYYGKAGEFGESAFYEEAEYYGEPEEVGEPSIYEEAEYYGEARESGGLAAFEEAEYYGEAEESGEPLAYERAEYYGEAEGSDGLTAYEEAEYYGEVEESDELMAYEEAEYYGEAEESDEPPAYEEAEYYGEAEESGRPEFYEESEYYEEPEQVGRQEHQTGGWTGGDGYRRTPKKEPRVRGGFFRRLQRGMGAMESMDKVILGTGVAVLVLALVTGSLYASSRIMESQVADFASVGSQLDGIDTIGGQGLVAVADAEMARMAALEAVLEQEQEAEPPKEYQEAEYGRNITVSLNLTSVQKDLKIKFINKSNGKLISNVPFAVTVTGPDGKSVVWSDDDMDGIIYKKDIAPGTYTVVMEPLTDEKYSDYNMTELSQKVEVKKDIDYKKVDVANEIKKESEINAAKEDTKQNTTVVESSLQDTVEWVESQVISATYNEVSKSAIPDPATLVSAGSPGTLNQVAETRTTVSGTDVVPPASLQGMSLDKTEVTVFSTTTATVTAALTGAAAPAPTVSAASADANVAAVSVSGTTVTVTGINAGSTAVTVSYTENGRTVTENFSVTVKSHPKDDSSTKLKDASGNQLFVLVDGEYREAVYADFYTADKFFVRGQAKYTGWQTLDGKVYYFTASGDKVTGEQIIQGAVYNFASDGSLVTGSGNMGIDVSKWNGNIDWEAVSNSGVSYVIIRCGYRGSSQGKLIEDPKFAANIQGATAAGLKVGVYFFTQAVDEVEAVEEASMVLEQIKGYKISYPVFLDVEPSGGRADSIDRATRTAVCRAFCETIQGAGYTAGIYANKTWLTGKLNAGELSAYKIWLAQYAASPTYTGKYDLWQYKSTGSVSGIKGKVDMNLSYLGY